MQKDYGEIKINLEELMRNKGLSKNKLSYQAEMNWKQIDSYCNNTITRLDTFVLCKLCTVLQCDITDLLEFIPAKNK